MMATAFMGYVLPWGQMSFWGATVITNLFSAIPLVGDQFVTWLWGGFSVDFELFFCSVERACMKSAFLANFERTFERFANDLALARRSF